MLQQFKSGQSTILVATDVAARGEAHVYMPICIKARMAVLMLVYDAMLVATGVAAPSPQT